MKPFLLIICFFVLVNINNCYSQGIASQNSISEVTGQQVNLLNFTLKQAAKNIIKQGENTVGSRCIFTDWVNGSVTTVGDTVYDLPSLFLNYDKIGGDVLMKRDENTVIVIDRDRIKSFSLKGKTANDSLKEYDFEKVAAINKNLFFIALVKGQKYSLYESIKTKFTPADYATNGLIESGNKNDVYEDQDEFYLVLNDKKNEFKKIELKKRAIKQALNFESVKTETYFKNHSSESINEDFLKGLVSSLNE